ncbi:MAG: hypothetical protein ACOYL9_08055 [Ilumatobacteraceae bacterium]
MPGRHAPRRAIAGAMVIGITMAATSAATLAGCSEPSRTTSRYCAEVGRQLGLIATPAIATPDDVLRTMDAYRAVAAEAPAAVEPEWATMIASLETASTVIPSDPASLAKAKDAALSSQPAATRIQQYTQQTCGTAIGTPPPATNPVTATTPPT